MWHWGCEAEFQWPHQRSCSLPLGHYFALNGIWSLPIWFQVWWMHRVMNLHSWHRSKLKSTNLGCSSKPWAHMDKMEEIRNTSLYVLYSCSPRGTKLAFFLEPKPKLTRWMNEQTPPSSCRLPFILPVHLCKQYNIDIMIYHDHLLPCFGWEKSLCMCSRVMLTCLFICRCPQPTPSTCPHMNWYANFTSQFLQLWHI